MSLDISDNLFLAHHPHDNIPINMSGIRNTLGGTQSPPLQDSEPLGVSNMQGDKPQGVPDAKQRERELYHQTVTLKLVKITLLSTRILLGHPIKQ